MADLLVGTMIAAGAAGVALLASRDAPAEVPAGQGPSGPPGGPPGGDPELTSQIQYLQGELAKKRDELNAAARGDSEEIKNLRRQLANKTDCAESERQIQNLQGELAQKRHELNAAERGDSEEIKKLRSQLANKTDCAESERQVKELKELQDRLQSELQQCKSERADSAPEAPLDDLVHAVRVITTVLDDNSGLVDLDEDVKAALTELAGLLAAFSDPGSDVDQPAATDIETAVSKVEDAVDRTDNRSPAVSYTHLTLPTKRIV